jgi:hypothetical protein
MTPDRRKAWKRDGSRSRPDRARRNPHSERGGPAVAGGIVIGAVEIRSRTLFASRRSPVRSRLAPFTKCLLIGMFW